MVIIEEFKDHLSFEKQLSRNTVAAYGRDVEQFAEFCRINNTALERVLPEFIDTYIYHLKTELDLAPSSVFRKTEAIKGFYKFLMIEGIIKEDPSRFVLSQRMARKVPEQLSKEEIVKLLSFPPRNFSEWRTLSIIYLFYASGIRVSELINLRLENLNIKEGWVLVFGKGRKQRFVPVNKETCAVLSNYLAQREAKFAAKETASEVFLNRDGKKVSRITVWKDIEALGKLAGIMRPVYPHLFRHTFASHLLKGGADLRSLQEMLGHENLNTTQIYTHTNVADIKEKYKKSHPRA
ncbi:MAG: tyrosine recombinase [Elusimicrobiota bacterium]|jgi:integrase/recombinase XerD|nr:tyrosine recombinase [Elusimicrobiota bacterium]